MEYRTLEHGGLQFPDPFFGSGFENGTRSRFLGNAPVHTQH